MPDSDTNPGVGCAQSDKIEACLLDVTGCQYGCSGPKAQQLLSFVTCLEHPGPEGVCHPQRQSSCASSAGVDNGAIETCLKDTAKVEAIEKYVTSQSTRIHSFPHVTINGRIVRAQDTAGLKQVLCRDGVKSACS